MCRCGCIEGMKKRNLAVVLEESEQLFKGYHTIYMGQKRRSLCRVTEHKGGGGGSGTNIIKDSFEIRHASHFVFLFN